MHKRTVLLVVVLIGLGSAAAAQKPDADMEALTRTYEQAFNKGDAKALSALYTKDAVRLGLEGQLANGQAAIEKNYTTAFGATAKGAKLTLKPGRVQEVTSDVRITKGTFQVTGGSMPGNGRYVNTVVRQGGPWRLASVVAVPQAAGSNTPPASGAKPDASGTKGK